MKSIKFGKYFSRGSIAFLILAVLIVITSITVVDADLWGHLRFGLDTLENGQISQIDPYSYLSEGQRWINHEWLAEVTFALFWLAAGSAGLILLKTIIGVTTLGLIYWYLVWSGISPVRAGLLTIIGWLGILTAIATVRPHMFTLLFTAMTFIIIALAEKGNYRWLWAGPVVFALWVNFHGGFLAGLGFLGIWTVVHTILHWRNWLKILPPVLLSFIAVLVNPYGTDLIVFLLQTATIPRPEIVEWQPLALVSILGAIYLILLLLAILGIVFSKLEKKPPVMVLLGVAALLPFVAFRHLPLFSLAVLVFAGEHISDSMSRIPRSSPSESKRSPWIALISVLFGIGILIWGYSNWSKIRIPNEPIPFFPDKAVSLLDDSQVSGNLAVEFNWGEYVIWHLAPRIKVSVDGRRETVYSEEIYKQNFDFLDGKGRWDALLEEHPTQLALVYQSQSAYNLLMLKNGWQLIYEDDTSALFAKKGWDGFIPLDRTRQKFSPGLDNEFFP